MSGIIWRVLIAIVCVIVALALIPPVLRIIGFDASGDVMLVLRICIAALALLYILRGPQPPWLSA
jgi:hypothetical protein